MAEKPSFFAILPAEVRYDKELSDKAKLIFAEITALANASGCCFAGNKYFADLYGVTTRQIISIIKQLEEKGYINVVRESTKRLIYICQGVKKISPQGEENFTHEGEENFTHNNTSINNINNNINCSEPLQASERQEALITMTLNDKSEYPLYQNDIDEWAEYYPAVDIMQECRAMKAWLNSNPQKRKTKKGIKKFINSWLGRKQDKGGTPGYIKPKPIQDKVSEKYYVLDGVR